MRIDRIIPGTVYLAARSIAIACSSVELHLGGNRAVRMLSPSPSKSYGRRLPARLADERWFCPAIAPVGSLSPYASPREVQIETVTAISNRRHLLHRVA